MTKPGSDEQLSNQLDPDQHGDVLSQIGVAPAELFGGWGGELAAWALRVARRAARLGRMPVAVAGDIRAIADAMLRIAVIERTKQTLDRRTAVIKQTIIALNTKADTATKLLPDPDHDREALERAKDVITGASASLAQQT